MSVRRHRVLALAAGATVMVGTLVVPGAAHAATFEVTNLDDSGAGSLRQAIIDANASAGADVITFESSLSAGVIVLTSGQLSVTDSVVISGPDGGLTVSGNDTSRVFSVSNGGVLIDVSISGIDIIDGLATDGAGILNLGEHLTLTDVSVTNNLSLGDGGGVWSSGPEHTLTLIDSALLFNTAVLDGGGMYVGDTGGGLSIERSLVAENTASENGGGLYFESPDHDVIITTTRFHDNTAGDDGGGIYLSTTGGGSFTIDRSTLWSNRAMNGGGVFIDAPAHPTLIVSSTISSNIALADGGGMFVEVGGAVTTSHSTTAFNGAEGGGGNIAASSSFTLDHSIVSGGVATTSPDIDTTADLFADFSLVEDASGLSIVGGDNIVGSDPELNEIDLTAAEWTHVPAPTSPAVDAGDPGFAGPPTIDQRGMPRVLGVRVDIGAVENGMPVDDAVATAEDTPLVVAAPGVLANDPVDGTVIVDLGSLPTHGTLALADDGSYTYTPAPDYHGPDSFTYWATFVRDGFSVGGGRATVTITVTPVVDPPPLVPGRLPDTGGDRLPISTLAAGLLVAGSALTFTSRRQRPSSPTN